jgi:hypothetical protein
MGLYIHSPIRLHSVVLTELSIGTTLPFYISLFQMRVQKQSCKVTMMNLYNMKYLELQYPSIPQRICCTNKLDQPKNMYMVHSAYIHKHRHLPVSLYLAGDLPVVARHAVILTATTSLTVQCGNLAKDMRCRTVQ